jgi:ankyrin repeat protein
MDTLPLPPSPDLGQYRKRAKELVAAACSGEEAVRAWAADWLEAIARLTNELPTPFVASSYERAVDFIAQRLREQQTCALANAQFLIARAHGFANWAAFARHVERLSVGRDDFEDAADAVVDGDLAALESLLRAHPGLVHSRSARVHRATLLHYVAANGVEDFRQKTPSNAVAIARLLLEAGAVVDAPAETYGGGTSQTTMNLLVSSTHPADAGLQPALVETLVDHGAAVDGPEGDGSPLMTALAFGYPEAADTLVRRGARVDNVPAAAALGRVDLVADVAADRPQREEAFVWACRYGRATVVELLLEQGVDPAAADKDAMTGLWAAAGRHLEAAGLLIRHGAPLEARNRWGGTVLSSTVFLALQRPAQATLYVPVLERLIAAGADVRAVERPTGNAALDTVLATT